MELQPENATDCATNRYSPAEHPLKLLPRLIAIAILASIALPMSGCVNTVERLALEPWARPVLPPPPDSIVFRPDSLLARAARAAARESALVVHYRPYVVRNTHAIWQLRLAIGADGLASTLRVSRIDLQHVSTGDTLIVPDKTDSLLLSPYPADLPAARAIPKLLLVSLRVQAFGAYDHGTLTRWGPTSTGRRDKPTPGGIYYVNWKAKERRSTIDDDWVLKWAVNLDSEEGIALHEYGLPGRPASHSCVRLTEEDATWMYGWVREWRIARNRKTITRKGTPVVVFGEFSYSGRRPWLALVQEPSATQLAPQELDETVADYFFAGPPAPYWLRLAAPPPLPLPAAPESARTPVIADRAHTP
jgi:hypothetical protein